MSAPVPPANAQKPCIETPCHHNVVEIHKLDGIPYSVRVDIQTNTHPKFACCTQLVGKFHIYPRDGSGRELGRVYAELVDKNYSDKDEGKDWISSLLQKPADYDQRHDIRVHTSREDQLSDLQKCLIHAFDSKGNIRPEVKTHGEGLKTDLLLFIASFEIFEGFGGTGLAQIAMRAFFNTVELYKVKGFALLSPAPLNHRCDKKDREREKQGLELHSYSVLVHKLCKSYEGSDWKLLLAGQADLDSSITLMGRSFPNPRPQSRPRDQRTASGTMPRSAARRARRRAPRAKASLLSQVTMAVQNLAAPVVNLMQWDRNPPEADQPTAKIQDMHAEDDAPPRNGRQVAIAYQKYQQRPFRSQTTRIDDDDVEMTDGDS